MQPPEYAQPLVPQNQLPNYVPPSQTGNQPVVVNQAQPQVIQVVPNFGTTPVSITCQFCQTPVTTVVETQCNCLSVCLCCLTSLVFYICVQCCRGKELGCSDAIHKCPRCGQILGTYTSC